MQEDPISITYYLDLKPSPETIELLEAFGYTRTDDSIGYEHALDVELMSDRTYRLGNSTYTQKGITDELLFVALASINENDNKYQLLIKDIPIRIPSMGLNIETGTPFISLDSGSLLIDNDGYHKATAQEITDLIYQKGEVRRNIKKLFYEDVLSDYHQKRQAKRIWGDMTASILNKPNRMYISLPITGCEDKARERCARVKDWLEEMFPGVVILSPFEINTESDKPYSYYMGRDVEQLLECQCVVFLDDWSTSKGCMAEHALAKIYGIKRLVLEGF